MLSVSFDLDGVLYESAPLIRMAYAEAGLTLDDLTWESVYGRPWREWGPMRFADDREARRVHEAKNVAYRRLVREDERPFTGAAEYAIDLEQLETIWVHTGASVVAAKIVLAKLRINRAVIAAGVNREQKIQLTEDFVHIDDDPAVTDACKHGIHYVGQSRIGLREQVEWTRSS